MWRKYIILLLMLTILLIYKPSLESPAVNVLVYSPTGDFTGRERIFELLKDNGFQITIFKNWRLSKDDLNGYKIILMYDYTIYPLTYIDNATLKNILDFIKNGGGIFLLTFSKPSLLADMAGITITQYVIIDDKNMFEYLMDNRILVYNKFGLEDVGKNVSKIVIPYSFALKFDKRSIPVVIVNNSTIAINLYTNQTLVGNFTPIAASYIEKGRIIISGGVDIFYDFYIYSEDNPQFIVNMFYWLAGKPPLKVSLKTNINRMYFNMSVAISLLLISSLLIAFFYKINVGEKWKIIGILLLIFIIYLLGIVFQFSYGYIITYQHIILLILLAIYIMTIHVFWNKFIPILRDSMLKLMIAIAIGYILPLIFLGYILFQNPPSPIYETFIDRLYMTIDVFLRTYGSIVIISWVGIPFLWLLFRKRYEEKLIYPHIIELNLPPEGYEKIFYQDLYSNYIFKAIAVFLFARVCPGIILLIYSHIWGGKTIPIEWINIIQTNAVLIFSVAIVIFTLKKAVEYGLTEKDKIIELRNLMFIGELLYTFIMFFAVPSIINSLILMEFNMNRIAINVLAPFISFIVGYIAIKIYQSDRKSLMSTIIIGIIILIYEYLINTTLLKPILNFLQQSSVNTIITILISVGFKKIYNDFEKSLKVKKRPPPPAQ